MNYETLKYKEVGSVGVLSLSRPKALNALNDFNAQMLAHLFSESIKSVDKAIDVNAFIERRQPNFTGKV